MSHGRSKLIHPCSGAHWILLSSEAMRLEKLPGWVVDDVASVREEVAAYVGVTSAELWKHVEDCAKDAMWAVRASSFPERVLAYEDPLPESTVAALARLRRRYAAGG